MNKTDRLRKVLHVEDNKSWREIFAEVLEELPIELTQVLSEEEARQVLVPGLFAVVTDLHLESGSGYEIARVAAELNIPHVRIASETGTPSQSPPRGVEITNKETAIYWLRNLLKETP